MRQLVTRRLLDALQHRKIAYEYAAYYMLALVKKYGFREDWDRGYRIYLRAWHFQETALLLQAKKLKTLPPPRYK